MWMRFMKIGHLATCVGLILLATAPVMAQAAGDKPGRRTKASEPQQEDRDLLKITKLYSLFDVKDDEVAAVASFSRAA
jgi:hypothetical protein